MTRITFIDPAHATGRTAERLGEIDAAFGAVPNLFTNTVEVALDVPLDFPKVKLTRAAA